MSNLMKLKRVQLKLTQTKLSRLTEIEQYRISLFERNMILPRPEEACKLAISLSVKPADLQKEAMVGLL